MPKYVIERQYLLPVYQRLVVEADTVEEACEKAIDDDPTSQNTYSLGRFVYEGDTSTIHSDIPVHFAETLDT